MKRCICLAALASAVTATVPSAWAANYAHRMSDSRIPWTAETFHADAVTIAYWHVMAIKCPFTKAEKDDLGLFEMIVFGQDDTPRVTPEMHAAVDKEVAAMTQQALARDLAGECAAAALEMRAQIDPWADGREARGEREKSLQVKPATP